MLNEAIIKFYVDHGILTPEFTVDTTPETILQKLTETGIKYTWETVKEQAINDTQSIIEVRVYLPSHILYGRHVYDTDNPINAHLYAISNAIKTIVLKHKDTKKETEQVKQTIPNQTSVPLSQNEILDMMMQEQQTPAPITTAEQFNNDNREEVPFEDVAMDIDELNNLLSGTTQDIPQPQQPIQQTQTSYGFTQEQIKAINDFKNRMSITNDVMLGNYINSWDNKLSRKEDLTPANIDSFIQWTQTVGKAPC